ncbi:MAG: hypothetical protein Q9217_005465 [Psora testacea]
MLSPDSIRLLTVLSHLLGWIYTASWSLSFYPQPLLNFRRRSTTGTTPAFPILNTLGFTAYTVSTISFYLSAEVRRQYRERHNGEENTVRGNDVAFALHALVYAFGYVKLLITVIKYIPQVWANHQRKSTVGWSIEQILMDLLGGVLSIAQLVIDSSLQKDWSGLTGNPVKFGLGNVSIIFDIVFMTQHYVLYRGAGKALEHGSVRERDSLLARDDEEASIR